MRDFLRGDVLPITVTETGKSTGLGWNAVGKHFEHDEGKRNCAPFQLFLPKPLGPPPRFFFQSRVVGIREEEGKTGRWIGEEDEGVDEHDDGFAQPQQSSSERVEHEMDF